MHTYGHMILAKALYFVKGNGTGLTGLQPSGANGNQSPGLAHYLVQYVRCRGLKISPPSTNQVVSAGRAGRQGTRWLDGLLHIP